MDEKQSEVPGTEAGLWRQTLDAAREEKTGFGGPLLLVAIGFAIAPFRTGWDLWQTLAVFLDREAWQTLTDRSSDVYHPLWVPLLTYELIGGIVIFISTLVLAFLFFSRRAILPPAVIAYLIFLAAFNWGDFFLIRKIALVQELSGETGLRAAFASTISACIWVPYFLLSDRVKNTFVR